MAAEVQLARQADAAKEACSRRPVPVTDWLAEFKAEARSGQSLTVQKTLWLARRLQERAGQLQTAGERRQQVQLDRMLRSATDKATLAQLTDQALRANQPRRAVDQIIHLLKTRGPPRCFDPLKRALLLGWQVGASLFPRLAVRLIKDQMRRETGNVILPAEPAELSCHLRARHTEGVRINVNFLGEAVLGEEEVKRRLELNLSGLRQPDVEVISVKISTLYSQISPLARDHALATVGARLEQLYRAAASLRFRRPDGAEAPKFVYLDMEAYRDLDLTVTVFMQTLDRPGLELVSAGLALQAYIPDSFAYQRQINAWARNRVASGGSPITVRLVKGANLETERCEASVRGWPQAPYPTKLEADANFKHMLHEGMKPENIAAVRLGIATHNLFDLAYALVLAQENNLLGQIQFEMLEGMANPQRRAVSELQQSPLLYAPVCRAMDFIHAIGYLTRRLDENTAPENFLRYAFGLKPGSADWQRLEQQFLESLAAMESVSVAPRRTQDRKASPGDGRSPALAPDWRHFVNEPDTDFSLPHHSAWAKQLIAAWEPRYGAQAANIPLVIAGEEVFDGRACRECLDPSRPGVIVGRYPAARETDVERCLDGATSDEEGWRTLPVRERFARLGAVAEELRHARADLIGAALANGGKTIAESDPEVSEAVDFVEFYRDTARWWQEMPSLRSRPLGVVVVISPWNFPIAIPCGGIAAVLAAGNTVVFKPASDTVLVGWELCRCFWRAGISQKVLQFLPAAGGDAGRRLALHPAVSAAILTGGTATALNLLRNKPDLNLCAETGGKNATIVTALADREQAIRHVLHSAFSHSGQKCSATSLLLLEAEVYDDPQFRRTLADAVQSLCVGSAWDLPTRIGPLIRAPRGDLERALTTLEAGESWLVPPRCLNDQPNLWSPGVKYGVQPGSHAHLTELFGPVLGVMRFERLAEAIDYVNHTGYGLTSGLESLDEREQQQWQARIRAGNLYVNRPTVGAIVLRQPFGGWGKSAVGPGLKAGGPNYVAQFMEFEETTVEGASSISLPQGEGRGEGEGIVRRSCGDDCDGIIRSLSETKVTEHRGEESLAQLADALARPAASGQDPLGGDRPRLLRALDSYGQSLHEEFGILHDHFRLVGQDNFRRYLPIAKLRLRLHSADSAFDLVARCCAALITGGRATFSCPPDYNTPAFSWLKQIVRSAVGAIEFVAEMDEQLAELVRRGHVERLRYAAPERVPPLLLQAAAQAGCYIASRPVLAEGRWELLWYLREQSLSVDYHRYGNLGHRAAELRAPVL